MGSAEVVRWARSVLARARPLDLPLPKSPAARTDGFRKPRGMSERTVKSSQMIGTLS